MPTDHNPQVSVKTEMTNSFKRLPSFRTPRDLKLTTFSELPANPLNEGRTKKVFVPNLNVTRKRQADDGSGQNENATNSPGSSSSRGSHRGRGGVDRGRGRGLRGGKRSGNFIQGSGVFSEGLAPSMKSGRWGGGGLGHGGSSSDYTTSIPKPRLKPLGSTKLDKEEEEQFMKELLRDDFIDDPENQADMENMPIQLPLRQCKLEDVKEESSVSKIQISETTRIKVKREQEALANSLTGETERESAENPVDIEQMRPYSISELLTISQDKNYIFFQIPTSMPKLKMNVQQSAAIKKDSEGERCVLRDLPAGRIGTLQILKSGKARLKLGDVKLNVEPATQVGFKQELISVNLEGSTKKGNMINMGTLTTRMIMTPQWESLLSPES